MRVAYAPDAVHDAPVTVDEGERQLGSHRGDPDKAFAASSIKLDQMYSTPAETHNPIELHATVASWDGDSVTLYETSQAVVNHRNVLATMLGVPRRERPRHHALSWARDSAANCGRGRSRRLPRQPRASSVGR